MSNQRLKKLFEKFQKFSIKPINTNHGFTSSGEIIEISTPSAPKLIIFALFEITGLSISAFLSATPLKQDFFEKRRGARVEISVLKIVSNI